MLQKLKKPVPDRDRIVILESEGIADIAEVYDLDDQAVYASSPTQDYAVPVGDLKPFVGPSGRIYALCAESDYVRDTERLAALERSIVLRQITHYTKQSDEAKGGLRLRDILLYALIGVLVLGVIFK